MLHKCQQINGNAHHTCGLGLYPQFLSKLELLSRKFLLEGHCTAWAGTLSCPAPPCRPSALLPRRSCRQTGPAGWHKLHYPAIILTMDVGLWSTPLFCPPRAALNSKTQYFYSVFYSTVNLQRTQRSFALRLILFDINEFILSYDKIILVSNGLIAKFPACARVTGRWSRSA